ncbi:caspase domain-containing protein [Amylostereum chailletii]|nr:caspase domain-containing protein [Amylostereum chailletii]
MQRPSSDVVVSSIQEVLWAHQQKTNPSRNLNEKPPPAIPIPVTRSPLHALLVGIDNYASRRIPNLLGAVADANAMVRYVRGELNVPASQVICLRNAQATRAAFIGALQDMASNNQIQNGDPILLYYSGHGTTAAAPTKWEAGSTEIQLVVPYDCFMKVNGNAVSAIPDRTLSVLLQQLADAKGDNITVIFDCCHSGSGTREYKFDQTRRARGFDFKERLQDNLDEDILALEVAGRAAHVGAKFLHAGLRSHVLLAACSAMEVAIEERGRGLFTRALLDVLNVVGTEKLTYKDLIERITDLPGQNPQCEGVNMERVLFNSRAPSKRRNMYRVRQAEGKLTMEAGAVHGITLGSEFVIYASQDSHSMGVSLGTLMVTNIEAFSTHMTPLPDAAPFNIPSNAYALQTRAGEEEAFRLHIEDIGLASAIEALLRAMQQDQGQRSILLVEKENADVGIALEDGQVMFHILDSLTTGLGLTRMYDSVRPHVDDILPVIRGAAHYYWHLRRTPQKGILRHKVKIEFTKLVETDEINDWLETVLVPDGPNLVDANGRVDLEADDKTLYGLKVVNTAKIPLYASMFFFDSSDLSVAAYYQSPISGARPDPSIASEGTLPIGYGSGGAAPYKYFLREGQTLDVGFIKLFLSTEPIDLSSVPQLSPFPGSRASSSSYKRPPPRWDAVTIAVVQHAPGSLNQVQVSPMETLPSALSPSEEAVDDTVHGEHEQITPIGAYSPSPETFPHVVTSSDTMASTQPSANMKPEPRVPPVSAPQDASNEAAPMAPQTQPSKEKSGLPRGRGRGYVRRIVAMIRKQVIRLTCSARAQ